ncbi:hypothetical protein BpHYR1_023498 [Brachionus plicatilis]|uniref:Uncharacterized protein n=1 Tax=Brachionus plicatilis TaxID=10195 RepID=A0A3M7SE73_BRAPC|nr:hypothetical protein BpHYR1_023498 [Brachionus plicatilis]
MSVRFVLNANQETNKRKSLDISSKFQLKRQSLKRLRRNENKISHFVKPLRNFVNINIKTDDLILFYSYKNKKIYLTK